MSRRRTLLRSERGYAMVAVLAVMLVASLAAIAAVRATDFDLVQGANDRDSKRAFAAGPERAPSADERAPRDHTSP